MSSISFPVIPEETAKAALAVFGSSNAYLVIGDQAEALFDGITLEDNKLHRHGHILAIFFLCTVFQHLESLPDRLAVEALQRRMDWKYAMHLSLNPIPMAPSALCEFRSVIAFDPSIKQNFQKLMDRVANVPPAIFCTSVPQKVDEVIQHVCAISRLATVWATINSTLQALATTNPEWLRTYSLPYWYERYGHTRKNLNLRMTLQEQEDLAQAIGGDGFYILDAISHSGADIGHLPEIRELKKVWPEHYRHDLGKVIWKREGCASCSLSSNTPAVNR